jgi:DNA-binding CsgD family transcriptional regulator
MGANVGCIRILEKGSRPRQYIFAAGPLASEEALGEWCEQRPAELLPRPLKPHEVTIINWAAEASSDESRKLLERYDVASTISMCMNNEQGVQITLNCSRGFGMSSFTPDDIARFTQVGRQFENAINIRQKLIHAHVTSSFQHQALDSLGIAAFLVGQDQGVTMLNETARFAIKQEIGLRLTGHGLTTVVKDENAELQRSIRVALAPVKNGSSARAMSLYRGDNFERIHLVVRSQTHRSLVSGADETSALIFLRVGEVVDESDVEMLQQQFSFTVTEAYVAIGLAKGMCLRDVEERLNIRHNTARAHLRSLFSKADVARQSQLVSLLTSSLVPLGRDQSRLLQ